MNKELDSLRDPLSGGLLIEKDNALFSHQGIKYPIVRGIPRFVNVDNYTRDFGEQWNRFPKIQLDSYNGLDLSESRLTRCLDIHPETLRGKKILEAGSGAGRFTEILLKYGAIVDSFDFSNAVEANMENNGDHQNLVLVQADIESMPFQKSSYDYVICLGVLQHTPNTENSIKYLWEMVKPGGKLVLDHYPWKWRIILPPPIGEALALYRLLILRLPQRVRFKFVKALVDFWFPWHWKFRDSPIILRILRRVSPVLFYYPYIKLRDEKMFYEWALLDTHDGTTDFYKHRRTLSQIKKTLEEIGSISIKINEDGNGIEASCIRPDENFLFADIKGKR